MTETRIILGSPLPSWLAIAIGVALPVLVAVMASVATRSASSPSRSIALALETAAAVLLSGLVLDPRIISRRPDPHKPICGFLLDVSRSMSLSDRVPAEAREWLRARLPQSPAEPAEVRRDVIAEALVPRSDDRMGVRLLEAFDVRRWNFAASLESVPLDAKQVNASPTGSATAIGDALMAIARVPPPDRPHAIVLLSDGGWNAGCDPVEAARTLHHLGLRVFAVGIGDPEPPRDVMLLELRSPPRGLVGEEMLLTARVSTSGLGGESFEVQLSTENMPPIRKTVNPDLSGAPVEVQFAVVPERPGLHTFTAEVEPLPNERDVANNIATASCSIEERKIRILLIESEPRWEYRFLRSVLLRDPAVELATCLLRAGIGPAVGAGFTGEVPTRSDEILSYDVIILGDVEKEHLPDAFLERVASAVRVRGTAVLVVAGRRGAYQTLAETPLANVLPVILTGSPDGPEDRGAPFQVRLTVQGESHLLTRLAAGPAENRAVWAQLPACQWSAAVTGTVPGATVLLEHPHRLAGTARRPLLAVRTIGMGKTMFCGFEDTWRWRKGIGDAYHYRFWAQAVRWLARRQFESGDPRARLRLDRDRCEVGESVVADALCLNEAGFPLTDATVRLSVERNGRPVHQVSMAPVEGGWGIYRGVYTPTESGTYAFRPIVSTWGDAPLDSSATLEVAEPDRERWTTAQNRALMQSIASAGGGEYLPWWEADRLPEAVATMVPRQTLVTELSPCRHPAYYVVMMGLLASAWTIRRRIGLP